MTDPKGILVQYNFNGVLGASLSTFMGIIRIDLFI